MRGKERSRIVEEIRENRKGGVKQECRNNTRRKEWDEN
jgi:hypothetical protein